MNHGMSRGKPDHCSGFGDYTNPCRIFYKIVTGGSPDIEKKTLFFFTKPFGCMLDVVPDFVVACDLDIWSTYHGNPKPSFLGVITHILGV